MTTNKNSFKRNKKYYFTVLVGIHLDTIQKLNYSAFGLRFVKFYSPEFEELVAGFNDFPTDPKDEFEWFKYYKAENISGLFFTDNEQALSQFYELLTLLVPSKIGIWLDFDTHYSKDEFDKISKYKHRCNGLSIWKLMNPLYEDVKDGGIFYLTNSDVALVNKIIPKYASLRKKPLFTKFIGLYKRAYDEEKDYFKYLLLFMTIESLIKDDEITGVVYKVRRLCAVLVGARQDDCEMIFNKTRDAYNVRSRLVHSAKNEISNAKYLPYLHSLVCELGIFILLSDTTLESIFKISNKLGYGQKQSLITVKSLKSYSYMTNNWLNFYSLNKKTK